MTKQIQIKSKVQSVFVLGANSDKLYTSKVQRDQLQQDSRSLFEKTTTVYLLQILACVHIIIV